MGEKDINGEITQHKQKMKVRTGLNWFRTKTQ
jgi:hypothetical protein